MGRTVKEQESEPHNSDLCTTFPACQKNFLKDCCWFKSTGCFRAKLYFWLKAVFTFYVPNNWEEFPLKLNGTKLMTIPDSQSSHNWMVARTNTTLPDNRAFFNHHYKYILFQCKTTNTWILGEGIPSGDLWSWRHVVFGLFFFFCFSKTCSLTVTYPQITPAALSKIMSER